MISAAAQALFSRVVDYAGLFPPAALSIEQALAEYARARSAPESWMLGRLVVPASRLAELSRAAPRSRATAAAEGTWRVSAVLGADVSNEIALVSAFDTARDGRAIVDTVELRAAGREAAASALDALPPGLVAYVELSASPELEPSLAAVGSRGARAKIRTGGVVADAIPGVGEVARFLEACATARVPFKATAGLHHAIRAERPLTYAADSPRAVMHGFLNLLAAAAMAWRGLRGERLEAVLREEDAACFRMDDDGLRWRDRYATTADLAACRSSFACSFGSCSFSEPVAELRALGFVP